jgi:hypothetical protein
MSSLKCQTHQQLTTFFFAYFRANFHALERILALQAVLYAVFVAESCFVTQISVTETPSLNRTQFQKMIKLQML